MEAEKNLRPDENDSLEKGVRAEKDNVGSDHVVQSNPEYVVSISHLHATLTVYRYHFDVHDLDRVQRRLKQRHVQM